MKEGKKIKERKEETNKNYLKEYVQDIAFHGKLYLRPWNAEMRKLLRPLSFLCIRDT